MALYPIPGMSRLKTNSAFQYPCSASTEDEEGFDETLVPEQYGLEQNYPNPFNPTTEISFSLPVASHVKLEIYNIMGQLVITLADETREAGLHTVTWDGSSVASGVYFYRLATPEFVQTRKMLLMK
jgi:hypothetical protein